VSLDIYYPYEEMKKPRIDFKHCQTCNRPIKFEDTTAVNDTRLCDCEKEKE